MSKADDTLIRLEDAISNIDYPGSDSPEWEHKAKLAARDLRALAPAPGAEVSPPGSHRLRSGSPSSQA